MDWARTKNILIAIFLLLNIFLAVNIGIEKFGESISSSTISNAVTILSQRGVKLSAKTKIPTEKKSMPRIEYEKWAYDRQKIIEKFFGTYNKAWDSTPEGKELTFGSRSLIFSSNGLISYKDQNPSGNIKLEDSEGVENYLRNYFKGMGIDISQYVLDSYELNGNTGAGFVLIQKYKGYFIYGNYISGTVTAGGVNYFECQYKKIVKLGSVKEDILPAYQILLKDFGPDENVTITGIDLGYKGYETETGDVREFSEAPVWRVKLEGGDKPEMFFKAYDGESMN